MVQSTAHTHTHTQEWSIWQQDTRSKDQ